MQAVSKVCVVGVGRMGAAYVRCFQQYGIDAHNVDELQVKTISFDRDELILLAVRSGADAVRTILSFQERGISTVLNLTTQGIQETQECSELASSLGIHYFGGGTTGGASQAAAGQAAILVGPAPPFAILDVLGKLGKVIVYPRAETAAAAKLLHNLVLIIQNHAISLGLLVAEHAGIDNFDVVLDLGTAGRKPSQSSAARDYRRMHPASSYTGTLVAKDLAAIMASFPGLERVAGLDLAALLSIYEAGGDRSYTEVALRSIQKEKLYELNEDPQHS